MSYLRAFGKYLPARIVDNTELAPLLGVDPEWIVSACGIEQRRYAAGDETLVDMGCAAARDCLENAGVAAESIGLVMVSSGSPDVYCPGPATAIAAKLGIAVGIDLPIPSAGSITGLVLADSLTERYGNVLVVASEIMSRRVRQTPEGKDTAILFGDGAGACLVSRGAGFAKIAGVTLQTDGERAGLISVSNGLFAMEGTGVIRQAGRRLPEAINQVLTQAGIAAEAVGVFLIHQANLNLLQRVGKQIGASPEKVFVNIRSYGNTSSASMLIAAAEWQAQAGRSDGPIVLAAFGAGLTWGAIVAVPATAR